MYAYNGDHIMDIYDINGNKQSVTRRVTTKLLTDPEYRVVNDDLYRLVWADDFDGSDIDKNYWSDVHIVNRCTNRYQAWTDYYVKNSILHLKIKEDAPNRYIDLPDNGSVAIDGIQTGSANYLHIVDPAHHDVNPFWGFIVQEGYWECRFKTFKSVGGTHTAWWAIGIQDGEYEQHPRAEIDITEILGLASNRLPHGLHKLTDKDVTPFYTTTDVDVNFADDYNIVGFLWENGVMKWYVNGELVDTQTDINTPQYPMIMILSAYKRISGTGWTGNADTGLGEVEFCVDYIKVYKKATSQAERKVTVSAQTPIEIDGTTKDLTIDSDRGCPICFPSYVYINWSDGTRTEHWVKWDAVKPTYSDFITNESTFSWHGFVYDLGIDAYATITF